MTDTVARARAPWSSSVARSRSVRQIARRRWAMSVGKSAASARASSSKAWRARMTCVEIQSFPGGYVGSMAWRVTGHRDRRRGAPRCSAAAKSRGGRTRARGRRGPSPRPTWRRTRRAPHGRQASSRRGRRRPGHPAAVGAERRRASAGTTLRTMASPRAISSSNARGSRAGGARRRAARGRRSACRRRPDPQPRRGRRRPSRRRRPAPRRSRSRRAELGPPRLDEVRAGGQRRGAPRDDRRLPDGPRSSWAWTTRIARRLNTTTVQRAVSAWSTRSAAPGATPWRRRISARRRRGT